MLLFVIETYCRLCLNIFRKIENSPPPLPKKNFSECFYQFHYEGYVVEKSLLSFSEHSCNTTGTAKFLVLDCYDRAI